MHVNNLTCVRYHPNTPLAFPCSFVQKIRVLHKKSSEHYGNYLVGKPFCILMGNWHPFYEAQFGVEIVVEFYESMLSSPVSYVHCFPLYRLSGSCLLLWLPAYSVTHSVF